MSRAKRDRPSKISDINGMIRFALAQKGAAPAWEWQVGLSSIVLPGTEPSRARNPKQLTMSGPPPPKTSKSRFRGFLTSVGPRLITGAADDDPSGIATYTSAGALLGITMLWPALITWPLMGVVQFMCARIGLASGQGLTVQFKRKFPVWVAGLLAGALLIANSINIGADLSGMA